MDSKQQPVIERLSLTTQSRIRSTQILISLPQIISEFVQNSLDAGAGNVDIGIDCEEWSCWVRDDGSGISRDGFDVLAGSSQVGRYGTSKAYSPDSLGQVSTFGFRGEALASAADLSCIEISSRTARSRESWSVILKGGDVLYNGPSVRWRRESPGTVVSVRDAFYNLPIRRRSHPSASKTIELVRKDIETFALVSPHVSFTLENLAENKGESSRMSRVMTVPKTASSLAAFRHLYGRALVEHAEEINESSGDTNLQGFISLDGAQSKAYQFLYVNRHPMSPCVIHRIIDAAFARSSFAKHALNEEGEDDRPFSNVRRSPRKSEKKPVYVLNLLIPPRSVDNCLEPAKSAVHLQNADAAHAFLSSVVETFLERHGFLMSGTSRTHITTLGENGHCEPSHKKRRKIVSGRERQPSTEPAVPVQRHDRLDSPHTHAEMPILVHPEIHAHDLPEPNGGMFQALWTDPSTGERFVVDTRTGNSYSMHARSNLYAKIDELPVQRRRTLGPLARKDGEGRSDTKQKDNLPEWMKNALETNEVYSMAEPRIRSVNISSATMAGVDGFRHDCSHHEEYFDITRGGQRGTVWRNRWQEIGASQIRDGRFAKTDLRKARVLGQIDRKFIACIVDSDSSDKMDGNKSVGRTLILIDQHAADERVRVERFLRELCVGFLGYRTASGPLAYGDVEDSPDLNRGGVRTRELSSPVPILLTRRESSKIAEEDIQTAFKCWGIRFLLPDSQQREEVDILDQNRGQDSMNSYAQVFVSNIPEIVADKLLTGDELKELVKGYLATLEMEGLPTTPRGQPEAFSEGDEDLVWQKAMRWCPRQLLELVNSKACRGAIMFNDSLTTEQCSRLVQQLSETIFPFQCAHDHRSCRLWNLDENTGVR
ncbi:uncharacterized protein LAESUDRAFT_759256 [Laetiporus sulphureus 93-53]|uniref:MutL C-terminal dimerisation domain-containing protein n=1 Tax=Laetiporus sulphureus 93-53 TaxID=1314785 RepID=A0A165E7S9_9APHY|nr:uncharacterized protein LAESUDRAFT_759256 [Laetiporus sulphureus 93-53]KZT06406.1 hypothetical protein LAESUDRAFT_759256 [Laetiporus sulphureus 93-53]